MKRSQWIGALLALALIAPAALAQDRPAGETTKDSQVNTGMSFRASTLQGMTVHNSRGDKLGKVEDLVIDISSGQVRYVAVSFGGFLGIGDKLFAMPMRMFKIHREDNDSYDFIVDIDKAKLEKAPGFDKDKWPSSADSAKFYASVDQYYPSDASANTHSGMVVSTADDTLTMSDAAGAAQHKHFIGPTVKVTLDGKAAKLSDLKKGYDITVFMGQKEGKNIVTAVNATSAKR